MKYLNGLIDLINTNISNMDGPDQHLPTAASSAIVEPEGSIAEFVIKHFKATLLHLNQRKEAVLAAKAQGETGQPMYE